MLFDFFFVPEEFPIPYDGIVSITILIKHKLRLDENYLEINNGRITLKSISSRNNGKNCQQKGNLESRVSGNQKGFLGKISQEISHENMLKTKIEKNNDGYENSGNTNTNTTAEKDKQTCDSTVSELIETSCNVEKIFTAHNTRTNE